MTIPDAAIEAAAEAIQFVDRSNLTRTARTAIEAAMPELREALAQEIEAQWPDSSAHLSDYGYGMHAAARIVRGGAE